MERRRRVWDVVLTIILLVLLVAVAVAAFFGTALFAMGDPDSVPFTFLLLTPIVLGVIALIVTVVLLATRRLAFWVPLVAMALIIAAWYFGGTVLLS